MAPLLPLALPQAPSSTSPAAAAKEAEAAAAAQQAEQAAQAAAAAFAAEAMGAEPAQQQAPRLALVENAEGADELLRGGTPFGSEEEAGSAGSAAGGGLPAEQAEPPLPTLEDLLPAMPPALIEQALPSAELPPALPPAELPPALPPVEAEAAAEVPVIAGPQQAVSPATRGGGGAGTGLLLGGGAMLRSPPRGLEDEPAAAATGGSPTGAPAGTEAPLPESLVEGLPSAPPPPKPLPLRAPGLSAPTSFEAAAASLGTGGASFVAAGGRLPGAAPFQLRGSSTGAGGNPFGPATPSRASLPAAVPAEQETPGECDAMRWRLGQAGRNLL